MCPSIFKWLGSGRRREYKNGKQETDQTVLTVTKSLTKTTDYICRAKKVEGHGKKIPGALRQTSAPPLHFQIRSLRMSVAVVFVIVFQFVSVD